ncbi:hypothetical protein DBR43_26105 [Pedobacter sp. KBW06]|uniref:hypothetical protein n=1 Tax=Pedobacter sp. KBW06 TaxID=2153359 RepID=UPI000F5A6FDF|nr:hypothetical protein [Pedobacter sp. KBW06]RQO67982.1 hypothetical protein DBR43_26105 [Pedobacter sp. KBW06]
MNFDDIKSAWNKESEQPIEVPKTIESLKKAQMPLDKFRKNMRGEAMFQVVALLVSIFIPGYFNLIPTLRVSFNCTYIIFVITTVYFLIRFYRLYKKIGQSSLTTKDSLYELNYDLKLNLELYKMFNYMLLPIFLAFGAIILVNFNYDYFMKVIVSEPGSFYLVFGLTVLSICIMIHYFAVLWLNQYYGKYAKEIASLIAELKEEQED